MQLVWSVSINATFWLTANIVFPLFIPVDQSSLLPLYKICNSPKAQMIKLSIYFTHLVNFDLRDKTA